MAHLPQEEPTCQPSKNIEQSIDDGGDWTVVKGRGKIEKPAKPASKAGQKKSLAAAATVTGPSPHVPDNETKRVEESTYVPLSCFSRDAIAPNDIESEQIPKNCCNLPEKASDSKQIVRGGRPKKCKCNGPPPPKRSNNMGDADLEAESVCEDAGVTLVISESVPIASHDADYRKMIRQPKTVAQAKQKSRKLWQRRVLAAPRNGGGID